jgi:hypothetical protein
MSDKTIKIIGWAGVVFILGAYILVSFSLISPKNIIYPLLNLFGSVGIIIEAGSKRDLQPVVINIFWMIIAVLAISSFLF